MVISLNSQKGTKTWSIKQKQAISQLKDFKTTSWTEITCKSKQKQTNKQTTCIMEIVYVVCSALAIAEQVTCWMLYQIKLMKIYFRVAKMTRI